MRIEMRDAATGVSGAFLALPHVVYAGDPLWIPEEEPIVRREFSAGNPWFAGGSATALCIAGRARLAVFRPHDCVVEGRPAAWFGYFETQNDSEAVGALLGEAESWARARGAKVLYGPIDFNTFSKYRVRVTAEPGGVPFPGEPYNPPYYARLLEGAGFGVAQQYVTQICAVRPSPLAAKLEIARVVAEAGYAIEPLDGASWLAALPELHCVADEIFGENFAYTPVTYPQFTATHGAPVARRLCPRTSVLARGPDGDIAGFFLVFPHYGPLVMRGSSLGRIPASELSYDEHDSVLVAAGHTIAVGKTVGVRPRHRGRGLMSALAATVIDRGVGRYDRWVGAMIRADNPSRRFGTEHMEFERSYALYRKELVGTIPGETP